MKYLSRRIYRIRWIALAAIILIVLIGFFALRGDPVKTDDKALDKVAASASAIINAPIKAALTVTATSPQTQSLPIRLAANGNIAAWQEAVVGAEVNGLRLSAVNVNVGDAVKKGQVLATFTDEMVRAEYLQAQAQYDNAKSEAARARAIQDGGSLSQSQFAQYQLQEKITQAQFEMSKIRLANTQVKAPDDGLISARQATVGAVVGVGQELFRLIRQSQMEWRAEITAQEVTRIKVGQKAIVQIPGGGSAQGRVRAIAPAADPQTRNVLVYVELPLQRDLKAGSFAVGEFLMGQSKTLTLPAQSIVMRDGNSYVFVIDSAAKANQRKIEIGRRMGDRVEVILGITDADQVALQGAGFLADGDVIHLVK